jgi:hypothetical protein
MRVRSGEEQEDQRPAMLLVEGRCTKRDKMARLLRYLNSLAVLVCGDAVACRSGYAEQPHNNIYRRVRSRVPTQPLNFHPL